MRYLIDAQLPPALARWLRDRGDSADHVVDLELLGATDDEVWNRAAALGAAIVSKDEDFALRAQLGRGGPAVVWIRLGNVRNDELLRRCATLWPEVTAALGRGELLIEIV